MTRLGSCACALACLLAGCAANDVSTEATDSDALRRVCGGIVGVACPDGFRCVDDPRDRCDPAAGGADCSGVCRRERRPRCTYDDPAKSYVSRDTTECSRIRFVCAEGTSYFADDCGCGCVDDGGGCATIGLCIEGYVWDDATCSCVPAPGEPCGPVFCASGEVCCNASCGICTAPDSFCIQIACL